MARIQFLEMYYTPFSRAARIGRAHHQRAILPNDHGATSEIAVPSQRHLLAPACRRPRQTLPMLSLQGLEVSPAGERPPRRIRSPGKPEKVRQTRAILRAATRNGHPCRCCAPLSSAARHRRRQRTAGVCLCRRGSFLGAPDVPSAACHPRPPASKTRRCGFRRLSSKPISRSTTSDLIPAWQDDSLPIGEPR